MPARSASLVLPGKLVLAVATLGVAVAACAAGVTVASPARPPARPVPRKVLFRLDSLQVAKDGDRIIHSELRTMFTAMPRPRGVPHESGVVGEWPVASATFEEVWASLSEFDFAPYKVLGPSDFEDLPGPSDVNCSSELHFAVDDLDVVRLALRMGPLKNPVLRARLERLRESVERPLRRAQGAAPRP